MRYPRKGSGVMYDSGAGNEEGILLDRRNRSIKQLDPVAWTVWQLCDGTHSQNGIIDEITRVYDVPRAQASRDVAELLKELESANLVEENTDPSFSTLDLGCKYCDAKALSTELKRRLGRS